jgi:hypothetical protein
LVDEKQELLKSSKSSQNENSLKHENEMLKKQLEEST